MYSCMRTLPARNIFLRSAQLYVERGEAREHVSIQYIMRNNIIISLTFHLTLF